VGGAAPSTAYRADIDGLRAIAVLAVLLYHGDIDPFRGGFVGVDIFFVISGYLISKLIAEHVDAGRFSLVEFYERRIRRILPAFLLVTATTLALGSVLLVPKDLIDLARSALAATFFVSNVLFWQSSGYFAGPAETKPLLHTWSLGVEEQFYLLFPLAMLGLTRLGRDARAAILVVAMLAGFGLGFWATMRHPNAAFYLAPFRIWELLLGAVVALAPVPPLRHRWLREACTAAGLVLIAYATVQLSRKTPFPGTAALLPCIGTALLIHAGGQGLSLGTMLLRSRPLVAVGLVSYSLYLWHWPALVFTRYVLRRRLSDPEALVVLAVAAALAFLSWSLVERPFRGSRGILGRRAVFRLAGGAAAGLAALALVIGASGLPGRFPQALRDMDLSGREAYRTGICFFGTRRQLDGWNAEACAIGPADRPNALLWGDSFAAHYVPGLRAHADELPWRVLQYTLSACAPAWGFAPSGEPDCPDFNARVRQLVQEHDVQTVLMAANWVLAFERGLEAGALARTVEELLAGGRKVVLIGQSPILREAAPDIVMKNQLATGAIGPDHSALRYPRSITAGLRQAAGEATFFDPGARLCEQDLCRFRDGLDLIFWDDSHLTRHGSTQAVDRLLRMVQAQRDAGE